MKAALLFLIAILLLLSCSKNQEPVLAPGCSKQDQNYHRVKPFENNQAIISERNTGYATYYVIVRNDSSNGSTISEACNLPEAFKKDSLLVVISGYTLTFPGIERALPAHQPIELTSIKEQ
ncbi:hypothetical protein [Siphonobacter sp. SORGH_AS_0500]|uniref:hypothetical protein n=1 Tax=Siphonobacter sp. SORGH_AS_0500 TaxID=1864824 RepID=UPI00285E2CA8|nr:hypothetical protein [Siphonobacter sp. SORGH_AS_0500]MDR6193665.1 hypothetical protein [Siphonobacter sp. SORGH_AS_0500]